MNAAAAVRAEPSSRLTVAEAASELGISEARVRRLIAEKTLRSVREGPRRLIPLEAMKSLVDERARRVAALQEAAPKAWDWEGNVVRTLAKHLEGEGWQVVRQANAATREPGVDLELRLGERRRLIEVKGWPTSVHVRGAKAGQPKRWPATMARNYFGDLLLNAFLHAGRPDMVEVAIAVPDRETFTSLLERVGQALRRVGIDAYVVRSDGTVLSIDGGAAERVYRPADVDRSEIRRTLGLSDHDREAYYVQSNRNVLRAFHEARDAG